MEEEERIKPPEIGEIFQTIPERNGEVSSLEERPWDTPQREEKTKLLIPLVLFLLTVFTTLLAGTYQEGGDPLRRPSDLARGIPFSFTLMSILFVHEMGHYITSKRYGVKTTLPYFIPGPWAPLGIGTFGAFIKMQSPILRKKALLDIGAAGPIAGFIVSIIAVAIGIYSSRLVPMGEREALLHLGDPLMFTFLGHFLGKTPPPGYDIALNSVGFAGWIGLFVTSLNLLPIGQLDGGHIAYALLGKKHRYLSIGMVLVLIFLGAIGWSGWFVWAILTSFLGLHHPPILDEEVPLGFRHRVIGWASIALFIVTFMPTPFKVA